MATSTASTACATSVSARLPEYRAMLDEQRRLQLADVADLATELFGPGTGDGVSRIDDLHVASRLLAAARKQLEETEDALSRLDQGRYGWCERCSAGISPERLEILPAARYCVACQGARGSR